MKLFFFFKSFIFAILISSSTSHALTLSCEDYRQKLYGRSEFNLTVAFGYMDKIAERKNYVSDKFNGEKLGRDLIRVCDANTSAICGFKLISAQGAEPRLFQKRTDLGGQQLTINLTVVSSAYSYMHSDNVGKFKDLQQQKSDTAFRVYSEALAHADVVFYNGHSREGGGPDFYPPRRTSAQGGVDYSWYIKNRPGFKNVLSVLAASTEAPKMLGFFSCASEPHFKKELVKAAPPTYLVLSQFVDSVNVMTDSLFKSLDDVLKFQCPNDFADDLKQFKFILVQPNVAAK